ncbi:hypothetical protein, partial [uncultured Oscillibacter sp.]|uniref:hypothetical protein n=1 Tax=uncultured Oscillibacter sp. TaxID=876091 RepID=UPI002619D8C9
AGKTANEVPTDISARFRLKKAHYWGFMDIFRLAGCSNVSINSHLAKIQGKPIDGFRPLC